MCAATAANRSGSTAVVHEAAAALAATVSILSAVAATDRLRRAVIAHYLGCGAAGTAVHAARA